MAARTRPRINHTIPAYSSRIRDLRNDRDKTQQEISGLLHIAQRTYADYELGNLRIPLAHLIALARYYNVDMNYICGITSEPDPFPQRENAPDFTIFLPKQ